MAEPNRKSRAGGRHFIRRGAITGCMDVSYPSLVNRRFLDDSRVCYAISMEGSIIESRSFGDDTLNTRGCSLRLIGYPLEL
jgi:hypothetical protein